MINRTATIHRETAETKVSVKLGIDGRGEFEVNTGLRMFDHLLSQLARHGFFDLRISASGADPHHLVEDVALCLGQAFNQALGEKRGIVRMGQALVPMDDALAMVAVDLSGRGYAVADVSFKRSKIADLPSELIHHFLTTFAIEARLNLQARLIGGVNDHHKAEAIFKALARALDQAKQIDSRIEGRIPSTKDWLE
jgi:imidazoleglycerol-phosphate dehydratase